MLPYSSIIIPAAGNSTRMSGSVRKPFVELAGTPILFHACRRLRQIENVLEIILVAHPDDLPRIQGELWNQLESEGITLAVAGGDSRSESVWNGMEVVDARAEIIAVHDAARPFPSVPMMSELFALAIKRGAAIPVVPLSDTVKRIEGDMVVETPMRRGLMRVQTPQVFKSDLLIDAFEYVMRTGGLSDAVTDEAMAAEAAGVKVAALLSDEYNFKITTPRDLKIAEALLAAGVVA